MINFIDSVEKPKTGNNFDHKKFDLGKIEAFLIKERGSFISARPKCFTINNLDTKDGTAEGFFQGVPQHWMLDWHTPFPIYIERAKGTKITDIDGNNLIDLCLGDTGAMFGHSPDATAFALAEAAQNGLTAMLPSKYSVDIGKKLTEIFGLPYWQMALSASDANRFALKVARLVTSRQKILVFDGCYHGAVDETAVCLDNMDKTTAKPSLWGAAFDPAINTYCVPFNDEIELEAALCGHDIACIIMEPALTNCGIVPAKEGFIEYVLKTAKKYGTLVLMDETHTISTGFGGYCGVNNIKPDLFVAGKAIAGGVPCGLWGFSEEVKEKLDEVRKGLPLGHSGIGTTLSGSLLQMVALKASLNELITKENYDNMIASCQALEAEINKVINAYNLNWSIIRIGARLEIIFSKQTPKNANEMRSMFNAKLEEVLHIGLLNRGILVTPFHNMLLCGPNLPKDTPQIYANALREILNEILN